MRLTHRALRHMPRFGAVAALTAAASMALAASAAGAGQGSTHPAQAWARYVPTSNKARTLAVEATTVTASPKSPYVPFGDASPTADQPPFPRPPDSKPPFQAPFYAVWVTDSALATLISERIDREKISATVAEKVYQDLRAQLHRDDTYVFYCHGPLQYLDAKRIRSMSLRRKDDSASETRGTVVDEHTATRLAGLDWASRYFVVSFPKRLPDGSPLVRDASDDLELVLPTGGSGKLVLEFSLKKLLAGGKGPTSIAEL